MRHLLQIPKFGCSCFSVFMVFGVHDLDVHGFHLTFDLLVGVVATGLSAVPETGVATGLAAPDSLPESEPSDT